MSDCKPGDKIKVKVGGKEYDTVIDEHGTQRFVQNKLIRHLVDTGQINLNRLAIDFQGGKFPIREYAELNMAIGYSVSGFCDLSAFQCWDVDNPLWSAPRSAGPDWLYWGLEDINGQTMSYLELRDRVLQIVVDNRRGLPAEIGLEEVMNMVLNNRWAVSSNTGHGQFEVRLP